MKDILTTKELGESLLETQRERQQNPEKWRGLPFGHPDLDENTGGARRGEMIVIAGAQKVGKTTWAKDIALSFAKSIRQAKLDEYVLYVTLEMGHQEIAARVFANEANIDVTKFRDYKLDDEDYLRLERKVKELGDLPGLWDTGTYNYAGLIKTLNEYPNADGSTPIRVIVIDYFQLFSGEGLNAGTRRHQQLAALSRKLKQLSRELGISTVVLSQQSRRALTSFKRRKDPNTLAGTQALVRDCDLLLMFLDKVDEDKQEIPHMREIYVGLARSATAGISYDAVFYGQYSRTGALADDADIDNLEEAPQTEFEGWWQDD